MGQKVHVMFLYILNMKLQEEKLALRQTEHFLLILLLYRVHGEQDVWIYLQLCKPLS